MTTYYYGPLALDVPRRSTVNMLALLLAAASLVAMLRFKLDMGWTLLASGIFGAASLLVAGT